MRRAAIWVIAFANFTQGTSELMIAGLVPEFAADLGVSVPQAGLLISAFAVGMLVGAPLLAAISLRWPRRRALLAFLGVFAVTHVISALTRSYIILIIMRCFGGFAYAGFLAIGANTAMALAGPKRHARAMSIVVGGFSVAIILGLPAGTLIGQYLGWRSTFWAVAALSTIAALAILVGIPEIRNNVVPRIRDELSGVLVFRLWLSYAITATATIALIGTFSYAAVMLVEAGGLHPEWIPVVLLGYGLSASLGVAIGGMTADRFPRGVLGVGFAGLLATSCALATTVQHLAPAIAFVIFLGFTGFCTNPALNARVFDIAPKARTLAVSGNVAAFNVGISTGPWLGGLALSAGLSYSFVVWTGAAFAVLTLMLWVFDLKLLRNQASCRLRSRGSLPLASTER